MIRCENCQHYKIDIETDGWAVARCKNTINKKRVTKGTKILEQGQKKITEYYIRKQSTAPYWCPLRKQEEQKQ